MNSSSLVKGLYESFKPAKAGMLSPLAGAAGHRQLDVVELLLAEGAELNPHVNHSSSSPLHEAVRADDIELARFLLEIGADVNSLNAYNTTALMYAVKYSSADMVRLILSFNPDLDQRSFIGTAAVHWAVWPNRPEILELLLKRARTRITRCWMGVRCCIARSRLSMWRRWNVCCGLARIR